ncbi:hypothetical protein [Rothia endophytica]|uniref:hypothetical protein n=1 Tax=Rothia endophytica TaxID=1324766 RepID=UPI001F44BF2F|nr:hypothetical protein [Rothia endophytica]
MAFNFSDFTTKVRAGGNATAEDIHGILTASPAATFALVEFAAEQRRLFFQNSLEVSNLLGSENMTKPASVLVEVSAPINADELTETIMGIASDSEVQRTTVEFVQGQAPHLPMEALRVLAAFRLASPVKSLHLGASRASTLRSLQPLAVHIIDSMLLSEFSTDQPQTIFEDLKLIRDAGVVVDGSAGRDLVSEYVSDLEGRGIAHAAELAELVTNTADQSRGGCGGNCACGSGGCS